MELRVLGKTTDERGTQLEDLTKYLLEELGYSDIVVNDIKAGGEEVDVRAERRFETVGGEQRYRVICECKAYKTPIAMPDWLKFLGKVFVEETQLNGSVNGCFIALSGVNGNVAGNFDAIREKKKGIELVTGDGLIRLLKRIFDIIPVREAINRIRSFTSRQFTQSSLCYYQRRVYWLFIFDDKRYTLLGHDGVAISAEDGAALNEVVTSTIDVGEFVDLQAEAEAFQHMQMAEKIIIAELMLLGGRGSCDEILENWLSDCQEDKWKTFTKEDLEKAVQNLVKFEILHIEYAEPPWRLLTQPPEILIEQIVRTYKHLLYDRTIVKVLGCSYYDEHIDMILLNKICEIQGNIRLPDDKKPECLKLLRWSPQALAWALNPDPMIVVHRQDRQIDERIEKNDADYFIGQLVNNFNQDFFSNASLARYFFSVRNLREVDTRRKVEVKGAESSLLNLEIRSRLGIGEADKALGGGIVKVRLLNDVPDPWDLYGSQPENSDQTDEDINNQKDNLG